MSDYVMPPWEEAGTCSGCGGRNLILATFLIGTPDYVATCEACGQEHRFLEQGNRDSYLQRAREGQGRCKHTKRIDASGQTALAQDDSKICICCTRLILNELGRFFAPHVETHWMCFDCLPTPAEYDPDRCVTAGELRAIGLAVPDMIPDPAWIPRDSIEISPGSRPYPHERVGIALQYSMAVRFTKHFKWIKIDVTIKAQD